MAEPSIDNIIEIDSQRIHFFEHSSLSGYDESSVKEYLSSLSDKCYASLILERNNERPLLQPRGGFPDFSNQNELTSALAKAGADFIPLTIDSHTRQNDYERAAILLSESENQEKDLLNGYPLIAHGFELTRELYNDIELPVSLRHGTPDARLLVENALAAGITEIEGGALCYTLPYSSQFPIDRAIFYWQYVDRLCAVFSTPDRPIHRESFGPLSATLVPPVIIISVQIIELLLAAEQGVTSFSVSFGQSGSIEQDIAIAHVLRELSREYLDKYDFKKIKTYLVYHQWMGAFPYDRELSQHLISVSTMIGKLINADKIVVKTKDEAFGIPSIESNVSAVKQTKYILDLLPQVRNLYSDAVEEEIELIKDEVKSVLNAIINIKGQSFSKSVYQSVLKGIIDLPFSPHFQNTNKLLTIRDSKKAVRILNHGLLPLSKKSIRKEASFLNKSDDGGLKFIDKMLDDIYIMV